MISHARFSTTRWGPVPGGDPVQLFTLRNAHGMKVSVSDLGATLVSWQAPDRTGKLGDILLGHDTPTAYLASTTYMGGLIGRWANRIDGARFTLDGIDYTLDRNEGKNLLHGGASGFNRLHWLAAEDNGALVMRLESPEGDAGFPGNLSVQVRYTLDDDGALTIAYEAIADAPTPLSLTSHPYFNLSGDPASDVRGHVVSINADAFFEVDTAMIPCRRTEVAGNAFDFRQSAPVGARLDWPNTQLALAGGFDHCYVLRNAGGMTHAPQPVREVARVYEPGSGRELTVLTDQWGLQFYTGNHLEGEPGRGGVTYAKYAGLCLEAGGFPNQINMAESDQVVLRPGARYTQITQYRVGVLTGV